MMAILGSGDEALLPDPGYIAYPAIAECGGLMCATTRLLPPTVLRSIARALTPRCQKKRGS